MACTHTAAMVVLSSLGEVGAVVIDRLRRLGQRQLGCEFATDLRARLLVELSRRSDRTIALVT